MKKDRTRISATTVTRLLFQNEHRCCICHEPGKPVQLHHIDNNPANNDPGNLAVLCLDHHSAVTGNEGLGRNYSENEVRLFKLNWEADCQTTYPSSVDDGEKIVEAIYDLTKRVTIRENEHLYHSFDLEEGDNIAFNLSSSHPTEFLIMTRRQYDHWRKEGEGMVYEQRTEIIKLEDSFEVPERAEWLLIFCNYSDEEVEVRFTISAWAGE